MRYQNPELQKQLAFRYVMLLMRGAARKRLEKLALRHAGINEQIVYWESEFQPLNEMQPEKQPLPGTWQKIATQIAASPPTARAASPASSWWQRWSPFNNIPALAFASLFALVSVLLITQTKPEIPTIDYVGTLLNPDGQAVLVTTVDSEKLLKIQLLAADLTGSETDLELWVTSKTDGEIRSLGVLDKVAKQSKQLSDSDWRLLSDAQILTLTLEESGGSAIGEPSTDIVASGLCIRLDQPLVPDPGGAP